MMRPDKPGYWWWIKSPDSEPEIVRVYTCRYAGETFLNCQTFHKNCHFHLDELDGGEWLGKASYRRCDSVHDIVLSYIKNHGYDGLWHEDGPCGCDGSAPCGEGPYPECRPAHAGPPGEDEYGQWCDMLYYPDK